MFAGLFSCKNKEQKKSVASESNGENKTSIPASDDGMIQPLKLVKLWETEATLTTSEGVVFDEVRGVYYVSCIGGVPPAKEDGDGYIATLDQKGEILNKDYVIGLDAPKGMAVSGGKLYVTDINDFVIINTENARIEKRIPIDGAQFLNDVANAPDGSIYFTDTKTNSIHRYANGKVELFLQDKKFANPNGIFVDDETIYLASFGNGDLITVDMESETITQRAVNAVPSGDGIVPWRGGFIVSNWNGEINYTTSNWVTTKILDIKGSKLKTADIAINPKSEELLVPTFYGNTVIAYKITGKE